MQGGIDIKLQSHSLNYGVQNAPDDFKIWYEKYYNVVFRHASYLTGSTHTAEDITQETFIKLYNCTESIDNIGAWLSKVATNLAYNYIRNENTKKKKQPVIEDGEQSNVISLEDAAIRDYEIRLTRKILDCLNPRDRMCLLLKFSGYKYNEISEIVGIEKNSVGKILARSQEKFKKMYLEEVQD